MANPAFAPPDMPLDCVVAAAVGVLDAELVADCAIKEEVGVGVFDVESTELEGGVGTINSLNDWPDALDLLCVDGLGVEELAAEEDSDCALVKGLGDCVVGC